MKTNDEYYNENLKRLFGRLEEGIEISNKKYNTKAAYMFLAIRDFHALKGNIDIISNVTTPSIILILEAALDAARNNKKNNIKK